MTEEENCRGFLELALGFSIERVVVSKEKSIVYHPEYRGVRLDIYAKDSRNTHYNVEMQVAKKDALGKRLEEIRESREMEERFMILEEMLQEERAEGMAEGIAKGQALSVLEILEDLGSVPEELENRIKSEQDPEILKEWLRKAVRAETVEQFSEEI